MTAALWGVAAGVILGVGGAVLALFQRVARLEAKVDILLMRG